MYKDKLAIFGDPYGQGEPRDHRSKIGNPNK